MMKLSDLMTAVDEMESRPQRRLHMLGPIMSNHPEAVGILRGMCDRLEWPTRDTSLSTDRGVATFQARFWTADDEELRATVEAISESLWALDHLDGELLPCAADAAPGEFMRHVNYAMMKASSCDD